MAKKKRNWTQYNSESITVTYFVPLFGVASRFYPKLYFSEDQVKLMSFIDNKEVIIRDNSVSEKRNDTDFISVLLEWRSKYLQTSLGLNKEQVETWTLIDDDIIALHKLIKIKYSEKEIHDLIHLTKEAEKLIIEYLSKHQDIKIVQITGSTEVAISRLHLKYKIDFVFVSDDRDIIYTRNIDAILE